jgi:hypothetical protein
MKPKAPSDHEDGLLEYLEDIIGTSKYKEPIDEAMVEMERLQEERGVKLNRLRLVEKEKTALEKQKREAEDYLRLKNDHARALSRLWQWILWQCFVNEELYQSKIVCRMLLSLLVRAQLTCLFTPSGQVDERIGKGEEGLCRRCGTFGNAQSPLPKPREDLYCMSALPLASIYDCSQTPRKSKLLL